MSISTYPLSPHDFPSPFNGFGQRMLHPRVAIWSYLKTDYQIYQVNREDYPAIHLTPTNSDRTNPFYFAEGPSDNASRTFTLYRPRARIHSHVDMAIWHTGGWLCRRTGNQLEAAIPILNVSDPAKLVWVGNVGLCTEGCDAFTPWLQFQTPFFTRPIIHNRILARPSAHWDIEEDTAAEAAAAKAIPDPVPLFVAETLLEKALMNAENCPICMDPLKKGDSVVTSCFHIFQKDALAEWHNKHTSCPVCKKECTITVC